METPPPPPAGGHRAVVLLGPTGSGKTPLGNVIQERGLWRARCLHFDFGANLREVVERSETDEIASPHPGPLPVGEGALGRQEIEVLREVLRSGALLEDEHFPIARRILQSFMTRHSAGHDTCIVLNGLPRHLGQARAIDRVLDVRLVVYLQCSREAVLQRIRANIGGDRASRADDDLRSIRNKLAIFNERTAPLLEHYLRRGATIETIEVTSGVTAEQIWETLEKTAKRDDGNGWPE
ncbi:MAG: nucleoside monophosphate kinase [Planctomycetota bacterium]|jgi:adenylate kinase family enzyme